jgi:hypothetical protein
MSLFSSSLMSFQLTVLAPRAGEEFVRACVHGHWGDAEEMIEGMLAEPWHLKGYQEARLRDFQRLLQIDRNVSSIGQLAAG